MMPHVDCDPTLDRYLVVFMDKRNGDLDDIYGVFVGNNADIQAVVNSEADGAFPICSNSADVYSCSVAFNYSEGIYLVVWGDHRNDPTSFFGADVYGQRVEADGTLLGPPTPPDPTVNFPIADNPDYEESVVDVTYNEVTNEWFVVYGTGIGYVYVQRVNAGGQLLNQLGNAVTKPMLQGGGFPASVQYENGTVCLGAKGQARKIYWAYRYKAIPKAQADYTECLAAWKGTLDYSVYGPNDVWCQRIGFFREGDKFEAKYIDTDGNVTEQPSNHAICSADEWQNELDVAYSEEDDEFLVAWGDERNWANTDNDLYCQRLWINDQSQMIMLDDDRVNTVTSTENILLDGTTDFEGSYVGVAHNGYRNNFLVAYTFRDMAEARKAAVLAQPPNINARVVHGSTPSVVDEQAGDMMPEEFAIGQNYPNPFNSETVIPFHVKSPCRVTIKVYDLLGHDIQTLIDNHYLAGRHSIRMNSSGLTSGVYFYTVQMGDFKASRKMVVME